MGPSSRAPLMAALCLACSVAGACDSVLPQGKGGEKVAEKSGGDGEGAEKKKGAKGEASDEPQDPEEAKDDPEAESAKGEEKADEAEAPEAEEAKDGEESGRLGGAVSDAASALVGSIPDKAPTGGECIHGKWDAVDYSAAVRRAIRKDPQLAKLKKKSAAGHVTYDLQPPVDGTSAIVAEADNLNYKFAGKVQGIAVNVNININGKKTGTYELPEPGRLVVAKPTEDTMRVKAKAKVKGFGNFGDRKKLDVGFEGDWAYSCADDKLEVWDYGGSKSDALTFERAKDEGGK